MLASTPIRLRPETDAKALMEGRIKPEMARYAKAALTPETCGAMDLWLKAEFGPEASTLKAEEAAVAGMSLKKAGGGWALMSDEKADAFGSGESLDSVLRLIEYGNQEVRGIRFMEAMTDWALKGAKAMEAAYAAPKGGRA